MDVQQSKKDLARVILSPHDGGRMDDSLERLQVYYFSATILHIPNGTDYERLCRTCGLYYSFRRSKAENCGLPSGKINDMPNEGLRLEASGARQDVRPGGAGTARDVDDDNQWRGDPEPMPPLQPVRAAIKMPIVEWDHDLV